MQPSRPYPEDAERMFPRNLGIKLDDDMAQPPRRPKSKCSFCSFIFKNKPLPQIKSKICQIIDTPLTNLNLKNHLRTYSSLQYNTNTYSVVLAVGGEW
jgi:hypothetical protein